MTTKPRDSANDQARAIGREIAKGFLAEMGEAAPTPDIPAGPVTRTMILPGTARDAQRFWAQVKIAAIDQCWLWRGTKLRGGYGHFFCDGRLVLAHRYAYLIAAGSIPPGYQVLHACDTPACCNPAHLSAGTNVENMAQRNARGRQARGERNHRALLTAADVRAIRRSDESSVMLARRYKVSQTTIAKVRKYQSWKSLDTLPPVPLGLGVERQPDSDGRIDEGRRQQPAPSSSQRILTNNGGRGSRPCGGAANGIPTPSGDDDDSSCGDDRFRRG
jgi:hypothetical protein